MSKKYTPIKHKQEIIEATYQSAKYIAPIPPPDMLASYNKIDPTFAERIIKMAEAQNEADIEINKAIVKHAFSLKRLGQIFSFVIVLIGFSLASFFGFVKGNTAATVASLIVAIVPIATATVKGMLKD